MKSLVITLLLSICFCFTTYSQIKIGDNPQSIDASSVLELESKSHVLVITRVTTLEMEAIVPSPGGMVYNTDEECIHYYTGTAWVNVCEAGGISNLTTEPIVNAFRTITITPDGDTNHIEVGVIHGNQIQENTIDGSSIAENSITAGELAQNSVTSFQIADRSLEPEDFASTTANQVLGTDVNGIVEWVDASSLIISGDTPNSITAGTDGGAVYDNTPVLTAIANEETRALAAEGINTTLITANTGNISNNDTNITALQNDKEDTANKSTDVTLSDATDTKFPTELAVKTYVDNTVGGSAQTIVSGDLNNSITASVVDGGALYNDGDSDDQNELQNISFDPDTNELTITKPLSGTGVISLNTATGVGTTEFADGTTITGSGTTGDRFKIEPAPATITENQMLITDFTTGTITWANVPSGGGGGTILVDPLKIAGNGTIGNEYTIAPNAITAAEIDNESILSEDILDGTITGNDISNGNVTPIKIEPGTIGQFLTTDATGVTWTTVTPGSGTTEEADGTTISGAGTNADPFKIEPAPTTITENQMLITDFTTGTVAWGNIPSGGTGSVTDLDLDDGLSDFNTTSGYNINVDDTTIEVATDALQVKDESINSAKITNASIALVDLNDMGATTSGEILKWNQTSTQWELGTDNANSTTDLDLDDGLSDFNTTSGYNINVDDTTIEVATDALQVKDESINSAKITNASIALVDLNDMGATTGGEILKWNQTTTQWELGTDNTINTTDVDLDDGLSDFNVTSGYNINVDDTTIEVATDALQVKDESINSAKITNASIALVDLNDMGATTDGQILKWNQTNTQWELGTDNTINTTDVDLDDGLSDFNVASGYNINVDDTTIEVATDALQVKDESINSAKITNASIALVDLNDMGATTSGEILKWNQTTTQWELGTDNTINTTDVDLDDGLSDFNATSGYNINVDDTTIEVATDALQVKDESINSAKITNASIALVDLNDMGATTSGEILKWNQTTTQWELGTDNGASNELAGSIFFAGDDGGGTGAPIVNATQLAWNNSSNRLAIGNITPQDKLDVDGQIRARSGFAASNGTVGLPSIGFYNDADTGISRGTRVDELRLSAGGIEAIAIDEASNLTQTTISNSFATAITSTSTNITLDRSYHTVILNIGVTNINLPAADSDNQGRIYILKNLTGGTVTISNYVSDIGTSTSTLSTGVTQLQSDGANWQQIN